jgi:Mrp family chromosome partitioning ATPase
MLRRSRPTPAAPEASALSIRAAGGALERSFPQEIVASFRHMLTEQAYTGGVQPRIAVAAALQGEGVTYTSLALAATLASDTGKSVCVVELNWHAPGMVRLLTPAATEPAEANAGEPAAPAQVRPGLAEVLAGTATLDEALITTELPNLALLPAGSMAPEVRPATARGEQLRQRVDELGGRFEHLILDIPAVLLTSDAIALASLGSACCIVVRQGVTPAASIKQALDDLKHLPMLGVVLNQATVKTPRWLINLIPQL